MTRNEAIKYFRRMWRDMYDHIMKEERRVHVPTFKNEWCSDRGINFLHDCPLCQYAIERGEYSHMCNSCPIEWGSAAGTYHCERVSNIDYTGNGLWLKCRNAYAWQEQAALAKQISELPEREA